ncbi:unnamed protein product [Paramecium pentaurelia]|uniref:Uncharacterized protein n=1 Tax=Paramecium pentaurelia TaxID=43138 RepID=A0A8S1UED5_9CILI|nr:unnamed protein product [Paramecium pentaurelia]
MQQKEVEQNLEVKFILNSDDREGHNITLPNNYEDFINEMYDKYQLAKTNKYEFINKNKEINIIIDSQISYKKMIENLQQNQNSANFPLLRVIKENQFDVLFVTDSSVENLQLASNYEQFQKKMENQFQMPKTTKYIYAADDEKIIIDSSSSYDKVLQNLKIEAKAITRTLKTDDEHKFDYNSLFFIENSNISCVCKLQGKNSNQCRFCNGTGLINNQQSEGYIELNKAFEILIEKNFQKIKKYIKDKYQENVENLQDWAEFNLKLFIFENQKEFYFKCTKCEIFQVKVNIVHVKSQQRPQEPVCDKCFKSNNLHGYIQYPSKFQQKNLNQEEEDFLPNQPPNLMQSSH